MRLTERDVRLVRDVALSHLLSRDQTIRLGYFDSITRANTRLHSLCQEGYLKVLTTPFHAQFLYGPGARAKEVVGERIAPLLTARRPSPQFVQHAMAVTDARDALAVRGFTTWRFEPQIRQRFNFRGLMCDVRPDGMARKERDVLFVEVDMGHVSLSRFKEKLNSYAAFLQSGVFERTFGEPSFELLTVTTSHVRREHLQSAAPVHPSIFQFLSFEELGITVTGGWS